MLIRDQGADLDGALEDAQAAMAPASNAQIAKALTVVCAVCAKPKDFDTTKVMVWTERMISVLSQYPAPIAFEAIDKWPSIPARGDFRPGELWPTENGMREQCDWRMTFRQRVIQEIEGAIRRRDFKPLPKPEDGFSVTPPAAAKAFLEEFYSVDSDRCHAYFDDARYHADGRIGCRNQGCAYIVEQAAPGLLAKHGLKIVTARAYRSDGSPEWRE